MKALSLAALAFLAIAPAVRAADIPVDLSKPLAPKAETWSFESPIGTYDRAAWQSRKEAKPKNNALDAAAAMGAELLTEAQYRELQQLEEFGNLQRRFTSDVSHELRTPLTTVRMAADLIHDHSEDLDPALRRSTELIVRLTRPERAAGEIL